MQLQKKLTNEVHNRTLIKCITDANNPTDTNNGIDRTDIATHMTSLNGPHTMSWANVAPVSPAFRLRADTLSHLVHYLLNLPHPDFINLKRQRYKTHCCTPTHTINDARHIYSHILRTKTGNSGGSRKRTHDRTYAVLARHASRAGYAVYPEQRGVIPAHHTRTNGKIPDFTIAREGGFFESVDFTMATVLTCTHDATKPTPVSHNRERANTHTGVGIKIAEARKTIEYPRELPANSKITIIAVECTGRFSKSALEWCKDIAKQQAERRRLPHLPDQNTTNEQGTYDPEAIKKFHYNVAEAQLELHRQNMEWCIGTIAKARHRHIDVEPEVDERPDMIWG
jgi:hypothetical protein